MFRILVLFLLSLELSAQSFHAAPNLSMGNTGIAHTGVFALSTNPAGIAGVQEVVAAVAYQRHYIHSDLSSQAVYLLFPTRRMGVLGIHGRQYVMKGVTRQSTAAISYGKSIGHYLKTSISLNYHQYQITDHANWDGLAADVGLQYSLENFVFGTFYRNFTGSQFDQDSGISPPKEFGIGVYYTISRQLRLAADWVHDLVADYDIRSGLAYHVNPSFVVRGGASSHPVQYYAGLGLVWRKWQVDMASSFHQRLGASPQLSVSHAF